MFANRTQCEDSNQIESFSNSLAKVGRAYLDRGWSIIPLLGKQPGLSAWKEYQSRLPTLDEVADWFASANPKPTGVGIVTGKLSGLVVVDCDSPEDTAYWSNRFPNSPLMVETGRGGTHIYYRFPCDESVPNRVKLFRRQIDVRGEGGYVAAPPSRHPSGKSYAWTEHVDLHQPLPLFDAAWLVDLEHPAFPRAVDVCTKSFRNVAAYIHRIHANSGEGGHSATFRAACKLRDAGLSPEDAWALLVEWNKTNANPPWSAIELRHKIESAYQVGGGASAQRVY